MRDGVKKALACVVMGVALALPAVFVNTAIGYVPFMAYVIVLVLSLVYVRVLGRSISFSTDDKGGECYRGEKSEFALVVSNSSVLPAIRIRTVLYLSDLFGGEGSTSERFITLGPHQSKTFDYGIRFDHIGSYKVGIRELSVIDLIGLFAHTWTNDELVTMRVQPRLFDVSDLPLSTDSAMEAKKNFTTVLNEGMDYSSVREYQWGDPIKTIHWKLSSRMPAGDYLTRLYETNANPGIAIIADFDAPQYTVDELMSIYDAVVECSFSLERYADANGLDAELIFQDKDKARRRFFTPLAGKRREILECMPKIYSPGTGREAVSLVRGELASKFAQFNLVVCSSVISKELVESLVAAKTGKRSPMLFAVIPETCEEGRRKDMEKQLKRLGAAGVYYRIISSATSLGLGQSTVGSFEGDSTREGGVASGDAA